MNKLLFIWVNRHILARNLTLILIYNLREIQGRAWAHAITHNTPVCFLLSQLAHVWRNTDRSATWLSHYESCFMGIHRKRMATENVQECMSALGINRHGDQTVNWKWSILFPDTQLIYHSVSLLYPNEASKPGYGQLYIFSSAETTKTAWKPIKPRVYSQSNAMIG